MTTPHHPAGHVPAAGNPYAAPPGGPAVPPQQGPAAPPQAGYAAPPQAGYAAPPQGGHAAPPQGGYAAPVPGGYAAPAPGGFFVPTACRACGAQDAANVKVRAHVGLLIVMRFEHLDGPFCRTCGISVVRQMTTRALCLGWWGPLSLALFNPFTLLWNLFAHRKFSKLPPSQPAPGRTQLEPGVPVLRRPQAYATLLPLGWAVWVVTQIVIHAK
ncbi:hypothetical protein ACIQUQ_20295 [Streptomyces sp. NPDC101118]|uniref:hypothetical protein n=1 Tax=Streptomyces sp. NPDC101118 TaxID=3366109 RepID=UPI00380F108B